MIGHALTNCEKCWRDAGLVTEETGQPQDRAYFDLYIGRRFNPCSREEQSGRPEEVVEPEPVRTDLSDDDLAVLAIEDRLWTKPGERFEAARVILGLGPTKYAMALNRLIDRPAAMMLSPITVNRLRSQRETGRRAKRWAA